MRRPATRPIAAGVIALPTSLDGLLAGIVRSELAGFKESLADELAGIIVEQRTRRLLDRRGISEVLGVSLLTLDRLRAEGMPTVWVSAEAPRFESDRVLEWLRGRS